MRGRRRAAPRWAGRLEKAGDTEERRLTVAELAVLVELSGALQVAQHVRLRREQLRQPRAEQRPQARAPQQRVFQHGPVGEESQREWGTRRCFHCLGVLSCGPRGLE